MRPTVRTRITLVFAAATAVVLLALGGLVYVRSGSDLLAGVDAGLRSRADVLAGQVRASGADGPDFEAALIEADESFAQIADGGGTILRSSRIVSGTPLLRPDAIARLDRARFFDRTIAHIDDVTRILAVPVPHDGRTFVLIVGTSLQDRRDQMLQLAATLAAGGIAALALIAIGGRVLVGVVLRPVDRMRAEAAAISALDAEGRLAVPPGEDEFAALARTLNAMLDRLQESFDRERRFVDDASHELRTPIGVLRGRLEVALSRARDPAELEATIRRSLEDAEDLSRLAEDLLVLSRARDGRVPIHRETVDLAGLVRASAAGHAPAADAAGVRIRVEAMPGVLRLDPLRVRQVLDNLLDNAIRHVPPGGSIRVAAELEDGEARLRVDDTGDGFPTRLLDVAFDPFVRGSSEAGPGAGLGLAIVKAVAEAHGGTARVGNNAGAGAFVLVTFRVADERDATDAAREPG